MVTTMSIALVLGFIAAIAVILMGFKKAKQGKSNTAVEIDAPAKKERAKFLS